LRDPVAAALTGARHTGLEHLLAEQRAYLDEFWAGADVRIEGDPQLQQAIRFALFQSSRPVPELGAAACLLRG